MPDIVPVVLFAYNRPHHLSRALEGIRLNHVPLIYAFSDAPKTTDAALGVARVRDILRSIDWCDVVLREREENLGLGKSIIAGMSEVLQKHRSAISIEDDVICVVGAYKYLVAALKHYEKYDSVMSVTGWTHPSVTPSDVRELPYFDGRAECWIWGTWARSWEGMDSDAISVLRECEERGIDVYRYGADLPYYAEVEVERNLYAVRLLYHHILHRGLCLRPPWSMAEHIGFDELGTNPGGESSLSNAPLSPCPPLPEQWPEPIEHPECALLWKNFCGARRGTGPEETVHVTNTRSVVARFKEKVKLLIPPVVINPPTLRKVVKVLTPPALIKLGRRMLSTDAPSTEAVTADALSTQQPCVGPQDSSSLPEFEHVSQGWNYLRRHPETRGWDVANVVRIHRERWEQFKEMAAGTSALGISPESDLKTNADLGQHNTLMIFAYVIALASRNSSSVSFLDWGGGLGNYYLLAKALLPGVAIDYHCMEMPGMAEIGTSLLPDQHFYADDSCLDRTYDLVLSSGSLHYSRDWQDTLAKLARAIGKYLLVTRMPVVDLVPSYVFLQRAYPYGYNTEYLAWCINSRMFLEEARRLGLTLVREFAVGESISILGAPEKCRFAGFLLRPSRTETV